MNKKSILSCYVRPRPPHGPRGFTLVELLVAITILIVLAVLVLTISRRMIRTAHRVDSMNDLRALTIIVTSFADDNSGRFPRLHKDRNNPHHFNKRNPNNPAANEGLVTLEDLIENGLSQETAFCRANTRWSKMADYYWYEFQGGQTAVFSYVYLANDNGWADDNSRFVRPDDGRARQHGRNLVNLPATPKSLGDTEVWYPILWADVCRRIGNDFLANFMNNAGDKAEGMNIIHLDGSGEWKSGSDVKERFTAGGTTFYW